MSSYFNFTKRHASSETIDRLYHYFDGSIHKDAIDSVYIANACDYEKTQRVLRDMLQKEAKRMSAIGNDVGHRLSSSFALARPHLMKNVSIVSGLKHHPTTHAYAGWTR